MSPCAVLSNELGFAYQVTYNGNIVLKHGNDFGRPPNGTFTLSPGEQIIVVDGLGGASLVSIGFTTNRGRRYGPWGGTLPHYFKLEGPVCGFYGGVFGGVLNAIGIWTIPTPTPPPSPYPPAPPPIPGLVQSPLFGGSPLSSTWDDGTSFTGQCPALPMQLPILDFQQSWTKGIVDGYFKLWCEGASRVFWDNVHCFTPQVLTCPPQHWGQEVLSLD